MKFSKATIFTIFTFAITATAVQNERNLHAREAEAEAVAAVFERDPALFGRDMRLFAREAEPEPEPEPEFYIMDPRSSKSDWLGRRDVFKRTGCTSWPCDGDHGECHVRGCNAGCAANNYCRPPVPAFGNGKNPGKKGGKG